MYFIIHIQFKKLSFTFFYIFMRIFLKKYAKTIYTIF